MGGGGDPLAVHRAGNGTLYCHHYINCVSARIIPSSPQMDNKQKTRHSINRLICPAWGEGVLSLTLSYSLLNTLPAQWQENGLATTIRAMLGQYTTTITC